ncbi:dj-1 family protein [Moniliophthora roreri]|nr:dj-1 family protein [Moniliophthora roreri]
MEPLNDFVPRIQTQGCAYMGSCSVVFAIFPAVDIKTTIAMANPEGSIHPVNFGVLLFPTFQALDVFGPLDALNILSMSFPLNLSIIAKSLDPVSTKHRDQTLNPLNSNFGESVVPTHDFDNAPPLDVLLIPGGYGVRADDTESLIDFIRRTYPSLKYVITVCTGSWLAARAGILDGKRATSNKASWAGTKVAGPNVKWVSHARWVVDGNIWTSSGVSAGIDVTLAFIEQFYGAKAADKVASTMEYERHTDSTRDPFADKYNLPKENE